VLRILKEEMKIGPKGQVVIPKSFRKSLGLHPGTKVIFTLTEEGLLLEKPRGDTVAIFEEISKAGKSVRVKPHEHLEQLEKRYK
jgi:AbrB family looped-hinge helix DNA binding protein